jgi:TonB family protein
MKRFLVVAVCAVGALYGELPAIAQDAPAQSTVSAGTQQTGVVLVKLSPPAYPPLARQARIMGDVEIQLSIRKDGSVESAALLSGHPMLAPGALASAKQSQFECKDCSDEVTSYTLTYTFHVEGECRFGPHCEYVESPPKLEQSPGSVVLTVEPTCECDPAETITIVKHRSMKCLYLWKCGPGKEYPL